jgi:hypothetical protein
MRTDCNCEFHELILALEVETVTEKCIHLRIGFGPVDLRSNEPHDGTVTQEVLQGAQNTAISATIPDVLVKSGG